MFLNFLHTSEFPAVNLFFLREAPLPFLTWCTVHLGHGCVCPVSGAVPELLQMLCRSRPHHPPGPVTLKAQGLMLGEFCRALLRVF